MRNISSLIFPYRLLVMTLNMWWHHKKVLERFECIRVETPLALILIPPKGLHFLLKSLTDSLQSRSFAAHGETIYRRQVPKFILTDFIGFPRSRARPVYWFPICHGNNVTSKFVKWGRHDQRAAR